MPHRIHLLTHTIGYIVEGALFTLGLLWTGGEWLAATLVDQETMNQLRSADGALFGAAIIVVALWLSKIADGKRMDKRHDEMITTMKDGNARSEALTAEAIKAQLMMTHKLDTLVIELNGRPCAMGRSFLPPLPTVTDTTIVTHTETTP